MKKSSFILILSSFLVYFNSLFNGFVYDDISTIVRNEFIKDFRYLKFIFSFKDYFKYFSEMTYRPLVTISFFVDWFFWKDNPAGWHLSNILIHTAVVVLMFLFLKRVLEIAGFYKDFKEIAFISSLIFCVHPINTEVVNGISFREDALAMLFILAGLIFYTKYKDKENFIFLILSNFFFLLGLFTKEVSVVFLGFVVILELIIYKTKLREVFQKIFFYIFIFVLWFLGRIYIYHPQGILGSLDLNKPQILIDKPNFLTGLKALWSFYLFKFIFPYRLEIIPKFTVLRNLVSLQGFFTIIFLLLIVLAILKFKNNKVILFSIFWILIGFLPVLHIVPIWYLVAERYAYISLFGFCLILGYFIFKIEDKKVKNLVLGVILLFFSVRSFLRNFDWKDQVTFWKVAMNQNPEVALPYINLAVEYMSQQDYNTALSLLKEALNKTNSPALIYWNIGKIFYINKMYKESLQNYQLALQNSYELIKNWRFSYEIGCVYLSLGEVELAKKLISESIKSNPYYALAYNTLGGIFAIEGRYKEAEEYYLKALQLKPSLLEAHLNLLKLYEILGNKDKLNEIQQIVEMLKIKN